MEGRWEGSALEELDWTLAPRVSLSSTHLLPVSFGLLEPQFPYQQNGYNYSTYFTGLLRRIKRNSMCSAYYDNREHNKLALCYCC